MNNTLKILIIANVLFLAAVLGLLLAGCAGSEYSVPTFWQSSDNVYHANNLKWIPVNSPRPGLRCWIALWTGVESGYAVSYCEEE